MKNELDKFTSEELLSKKKTLSAIIFIISMLIFLFFVYLGYVLYQGIWKTHHLAGIVSIAVLSSVIAINATQIQRIGKEIEKRAKGY